MKTVNNVLLDVEYAHKVNNKDYVLHPMRNTSGRGSGKYSIIKIGTTTPNEYITEDEFAELLSINGFEQIGIKVRMWTSDGEYGAKAPPMMKPTLGNLKANTKLALAVKQKFNAYKLHGLSAGVIAKLSKIGIFIDDNGLTAPGSNITAPDFPAVLPLGTGSIFKNSEKDSDEYIPGIGANGIRQPTPLSSDPKRDLVISVDVQGSLESDTQSLKTDEREAVVKVRFGQGSFREALFNEKGHGARCWMSGIEGGRLLIASHIKPWSHCENDADSRGRTDNGLLLSALWDAAFDAGLVSFGPDWKVIASSELTESARRALCLDKYLALPEKFRTDGRKAYLAYHLAKVFEYWKKMGLA